LFDLPSLLILTVFDEEAHIGNSGRIDDKKQIGLVIESITKRRLDQ
jgi:hypothetical protein